MTRTENIHRYDLSSRLFGDAQAIVNEEIARHGQGDLLAAMRTVTEPAIRGLMDGSHFNAAARWLVRMDGAAVWRSVGDVCGTHELAKSVCEHFVEAGFTAKARFLWKAIVVTRYCAMREGWRQIRHYEKHYQGKRRPTDVIEFLQQCHELVDDVTVALGAGIDEWIALCDRFEWSEERERAEALRTEAEKPIPGRPKHKRPKAESTDDSLSGLLQQVASEAESPEFLADRLADLLQTRPVGKIVRFKKSFLAEVEEVVPQVERLLAKKDRNGTMTTPDAVENLAITLVSALSVETVTAAGLQRAEAAHQRAQGSPSVAFEAPDLAYQWKNPNGEQIFPRIQRDPLALPNADDVSGL